MPEFKKKSVRFDHLEPTYTSYSTQSEIQTYDLEDMLKQIARIARAEPMDTKKIIDGDSYIFHVCKYHDEDNLWELRVLRIREKILPGILHDDGTYELIKLGNDEVTAESTTLAYAPATHTFIHAKKPIWNKYSQYGSISNGTFAQRYRSYISRKRSKSRFAALDRGSKL